jgi:hypothetical protein
VGFAGEKNERVIINKKHFPAILIYNLWDTHLHSSCADMLKREQPFLPTDPGFRGFETMITEERPARQDRRTVRDY